MNLTVTMRTQQRGHEIKFWHTMEMYKSHFFLNHEDMLNVIEQYATQWDLDVNSLKAAYNALKQTPPSKEESITFLSGKMPDYKIRRMLKTSIDRIKAVQSMGPAVVGDPILTEEMHTWIAGFNTSFKDLVYALLPITYF